MFKKFFAACCPVVDELCCHARQRVPLCVCAQVLLPPSVPPSLGFFRADGCYLINNGQVLVVWLGRDLSATWLTQVGRSSSSTATAASSTRHCVWAQALQCIGLCADCLSVVIVWHAQPASKMHNARGWRACGPRMLFEQGVGRLVETISTCCTLWALAIFYFGTALCLTAQLLVCWFSMSATQDPVQEQCEPTD